MVRAKEAAYIRAAAATREANDEDGAPPATTPGGTRSAGTVLDVPGGTDLAGAIRYWAPVYGISVALMDCLAVAESTYGTNPRAYDGSSGYQGAFQFLLSTWLGAPPGMRGESAYDDWAAAEGTAWMISVGRLREWPTSWGC